MRVHGDGLGGEGKKLAAGLRVLLYHPKWAARECEDCRKHVYDKEGNRQTDRLGLPLVRVPGAPLPCWECGKIPPGAPARHWKYAEELSEQNWQFYAAYRQWRAVGLFPADPIVYRLAAVVRSVEDAWERHQTSGRLETLIQLLSLARGK